jgi:hypothetical protein
MNILEPGRPRLGKTTETAHLFFSPLVVFMMNILTRIV